MNAVVQRDFWRNSGYCLLNHDLTGNLVVTDNFLRAYFLRPELRPLDDSPESEVSLHEQLMENPRMGVPLERLLQIPDGDVRDNYRVFLDFRERLIACDSLESCYLGIFSEGNVSVPPLLIDQMTHVILRSILDGCDDPLQLRVAELFFRKQRASIQNGAVMLADFDVVEEQASGGALGNIGRLMAEAHTPIKKLNLDVLELENADLYWSRDQHHDFVVRINHGSPAAQAFCKVLEAWIFHFCKVKVKFRSISAIEEERWSWHIGLDAESTALLNDLWRGHKVDQGGLQRIISLYRLEFAEISDMRADIAGRVIYLALSMDADGVVRMKPQNLLTNLPVAAGG